MALEMPAIGMPQPHVTPYLAHFRPLLEAALPDAQPVHEEDGIDFRPQSLGYDSGLARGFKTPHATRILERLVPGNSSILGRVHAQTFTAQCRDGYAIPNLFVEWAELDDLLTGVLDLFPLADLALDENYRVQMLDPLEETWEGFRRFAGAGYNQNMFRFVRAIASPVYVGYKLPRTPENVERCLALHEAYLRHWLSLVASAEPVANPEEAARLDRRKRAMIASILTNASDLNDLVPQLIGRERAALMGPITARGYRPPARAGLARFAAQEPPVLEPGHGDAVRRFAAALELGMATARPSIPGDWEETLAVVVPGDGTLAIRFSRGAVLFQPGAVDSPAHVVRQSLDDFRDAVTDAIPFERLWTRLSEPFTREYVLLGNGLKLAYLYQAVRQTWRNGGPPAREIGNLLGI